jgi:TolA-binding protein
VRQVVEQDTSETEWLKQRLAIVERKAAEADFRERLARDESRETRELMAQYLPGSLKGLPQDSSTYQLRTIASVTNSTVRDLRIERGTSLLEKAKEEFRSKKFEFSNRQLRELLALYPDSLHAPEARFLLAEGLYQVRDLEGCVEVIEEMIRLYPESELTGFALLRLARIYESRDRIEDAAEVYRSISSHFTQEELKKQAKEALKAVDL